MRLTAASEILLAHTLALVVVILAMATATLIGTAEPTKSSDRPSRSGTDHLRLGREVKFSPRVKLEQIHE